MPLHPERTVEVADTVVHTDLAQANLMRLRGDFAGAEQRCLKILKRYPNDPSTHTLLGDIHADQGDWQRAAEWYELALDLSPNSPLDQQKLEMAQSHLSQNEARETAAQLELPASGTKPAFIAIGVAALVLIAAVVAYGVTRHMQTAPPIQATIDASPQPPSLGAPQPNGSAPVTAPPGAVASQPMEDVTLQNLLKLHSSDGARVVAVEFDPRGKSAIITYSASTGDDVRKVGATLARDLFAQSPDTQSVTVRAVENNRLAYLADATRESLSKLMPAESGANDAPEDPTLILQNEWTAPATAPGTGVNAASSPTGTGSAAPSSVSTTTTRPGNP